MKTPFSTVFTVLRVTPIRSASCAWVRPISTRRSLIPLASRSGIAVRAALELAHAGDEPMKGDDISEAQDIPLKFLENILGELKHSGIVQSRRGAHGGYWLAKDSDSNFETGNAFKLFHVRRS